MRIYLPATLPLLRELHRNGMTDSTVLTAFAVTPSLREWYAEGDEEELEYAAFNEAARASLRLLDADPMSPRRRVVVSAEVADPVVVPRPELDRSVVGLAGPIASTAVVAVHVDGEDAVPDISSAVKVVLEADLGDEDAQFTVDGAEGYELQWYDPSELESLLG
jgi:hypothetical protein